MNILARTMRDFSTTHARNWIRALVPCLLSASPLSAQAQPGSLTELLDFRTVPRIKSWRVEQASGYDRLGGFYDSGNFLRVEPGRRYVLLDTTGAGVIDRMWFTSKGAFGTEPYELLIYLDGSDSPAIRADVDRLCGGGKPPFVPPLTGLCGNPQYPGRYSYVPIGFTSSCRVILQPLKSAEKYRYRTNNAGETIPHVYYQITYRLLDEGTPVRPFSWDLSRQEQDALERVRAVWSRPGTDLVAGERRQEVQVDVAPRGGATLATFSGGGTITSLRLRVNRPDALELRFTWDGGSRPSVAVPFGPFFGCAETEVSNSQVRGLWFGYDQGVYYQLLPMPFREGATLEVHSRRDEPVQVSGAVTYQTTPPDVGDLYFHARRYDHDPPPVDEDYLVLAARGAGHFVALVMDRPGNMEGDDRFHIDGDEKPAVHGTGTEDFFNFAWGLSHVGSYPLHGISAQAGGPCCYRVLFPGAVPFEQSLQVKWEHGHDVRQGANLDQSRYSGVALFYLRADNSDELPGSSDR